MENQTVHNLWRAIVVVALATLAKQQEGRIAELESEAEDTQSAWDAASERNAAIIERLEREGRNKEYKINDLESQVYDLERKNDRLESDKRRAEDEAHRYQHEADNLRDQLSRSNYRGW